MFFNTRGWCFCFFFFSIIFILALMLFHINKFLHVYMLYWSISYMCRTTPWTFSFPPTPMFSSTTPQPSRLIVLVLVLVLVQRCIKCTLYFRCNLHLTVLCWFRGILFILLVLVLWVISMTPWNQRGLVEIVENI